MDHIDSFLVKEDDMEYVSEGWMVHVSYMKHPANTAGDSALAKDIVYYRWSEKAAHELEAFIINLYVNSPNKLVYGLRIRIHKLETVSDIELDYEIDDK